MRKEERNQPRACTQFLAESFYPEALKHVSEEVECGGEYGARESDFWAPVLYMPQSAQ